MLNLVRRTTVWATAGAALLAMGGSSLAQTPIPCKGPFAKCIQDIGGWCESDGKGGQHMVYWDRTSASSRFEQCIGKVFEENGRANPYKPAPQASTPKR